MGVADRGPQSERLPRTTKTRDVAPTIPDPLSPVRRTAQPSGLTAPFAPPSASTGDDAVVPGTAVGCGARIGAPIAERPELIVATPMERAVGRAQHRAVAAGRDACDARPGWQGHSGRRRLVDDRAITELRFEVVPPRPDTAIGSGGDAVPRPGRERHDIPKVHDEAGAIDRASVAELSVAPSPERVQPAIACQRQRMKPARLDGDDLACQFRNRDRHEDFRSAPGPRTLPHRTVARAVEVPGAREGDTEAVSCRDLRDRLVREGRHERGAFALIERVAHAEGALRIRSPAVDLAVGREREAVFGCCGDRHAVAQDERRGRAAVAAPSAELAHDVVAPGDDLAVVAQGDDVVPAERDVRILGKRGRNETEDEEGPPWRRARSWPVF